VTDGGESALGQTFRIRDSEPDAPLSFTASLGLAALLHDLVEPGSQIVVATRSPVLAAIPGAHLLELGSRDIQPAAWDDLSLVVAWRQFMRDPRAFSGICGDGGGP
jgi:predicted ATPase